MPNVKPKPRPAGRPPPTFPATLTALRESAELSIPELATMSGVSDDSIRLYEAGTRLPSWIMIQKLATALGVPTDAFRGA